MYKNAGVLRPQEGDRRFIVYFVLYLSALLLLVQAPFTFFDWLNRFTASTSALFWGLFPLPVSRAGTIVTVYDFPMEITRECTALHYLAIFGAGVLAHRSHSRSYRAAGIAGGIAVILSLNIVRIGILGMVGHYARNLFDLVHAYLLQGVFAVAVFAAWYLWAAGGVRITRKSALAAGLSVLAGLCALGLLLLLIDEYARCLAAVTNGLLHVLGAGSGAGLEAASEGRVVLLRTASGTLHVDLFFEVFNGIILAALAAMSVPYLPGVTAAKRGILAGGLLCLQHIATLAVYGVSFADGLGQSSLITVMWTTRGFGMVAPVLLWYIAGKAFPVKA